MLKRYMYLKTDGKWMNELGCRCSTEQQVYVSGSVCLLKSGHCGLTCCAVSPWTIIHLTLIRHNPPQPWLRLHKLTTKPQTVHLNTFALIPQSCLCCCASPRPKNIFCSSFAIWSVLLSQYSAFIHQIHPTSHMYSQTAGRE